ncbi:ATP-dependent helicase/nuclease subunit A [Halobacillus andaensis]|uniref:ATP-dependent helicase/nuclease subunit A n=1 Tax=Halobacillus andaensis TaxID=1176239 RepID=A0A917EV00_HALAA|nr:helicase-exonuclease AddAB subunit AddA [Halobacillus andaensis]MBP2004099.1 ATP-dependent helicase/nuclease subunit A [Halobacillus andaensis]GGF15795.1 ATP-dependent helicase/nuclease subunit A [Halobacillus andaensis]
MVSWTKEQERAIYTQGKNILVSAAAGSGKTAVLVERIIQKLLNKEAPVNIDSLLVVTFTNAAAQEMRNRVGLALSKSLESNPESRHLKKQLSLLQNASISTLHSFCMEVVRKYAYLLDLDPGFRIADDVEADLIRQEVLEDLFEDWYGKEGKEQQQFFDVVDRFSSDRNDLDVEKLVLDLHTFSMQNPWPEQWLEDMVAMYQDNEVQNEEDLPWLQLLKRDVKSQLDSMEAEIQQLVDLTREADGPSSYGETAALDLEMVQQAKGALEISWEELQTYMSTSKFAALSRKKMECDEKKKERAKKIRDRYKKRWMSMKEEWFHRKLVSYLNDMKALHPVMKQLAVVVQDFHERYQQLKKEKALVDFSDLEHYCLQILVDETSTKENLVPSSVAKSFHDQFSEVLIDEYQDTNLVQETLLRLLTDDPEAGHLFMVGDVKQSIYRFRHAEPSLFLTKYKLYGQADHDGERIDLARNFRSRKQVLDAANYVFRQVLDEEVGEMNYEPEAELIYSNSVYDENPSDYAKAELLIIDREAKEEQSQEESFEDLEKAQLEARAYGEKIRTWLGYGEEEPLQVVDKETGVKRPVQYRDIVILMRSMTWASTIVDELKQQGIPVYAELSTGYFEAIEVKVMLNLLKIIDNPLQDIPLASVLKSPIVGLNEDELMQLRLEEKRVSYFESIKLAAGRSEIGKKITHFLKQLDDFRERARQGALSDLIWQIYRETGYYDFVGGMPGGRQRQANLRALYDRARSYESTSFRGLFRFLRFIERMEERGDDLGAARALGEQEDVVRIMTIHKSKGLEFPVVLLGAMDKQFNMMDLKERYLLHKDYGFGSRYIDPNKRLMYPTLAYHAIKRVKLRELLAEEMRVLYVALTRAKEKLVMVGNVASFEKKQEKWMSYLDHPDWVLPPHHRLEAKSYLDWVGPSLIRHQDSEALRTDEVEVKTAEEIEKDASEWEIHLAHGSEYAVVEEMEQQRDEKLQEHIEQWNPVEVEADERVDRLDFLYPYQKAAHSRAKQTVTEIKRQREVLDEYSSDQLLVPNRAPLVKRPRFMQEKQGLSAGERGTAMHTVMQHLPLRQPKTLEEVEEFVEHLVHKEVLRREEADEINYQAIANFFETPMGKLVQNAEHIEREVPFSLTLPADEVYQDWEEATEEKVFIQGVIDAVIPYGEGWLILDYKTDAIPEGEHVQEQLKERYRTQIQLYKTALEKIWKKPVEKSYLYFFNGSLTVEVE